MARTRNSTSTTVPPPVGGWNARDPLEIMSPADAVRLVNFFPDVADITTRNGFTEHADGMGSGAVQTLVEFADSDGTRQLIAGANGNIYDATSSGVSATSLGSGFTSNKWQTVIFKNKLILVNGSDQPQQYDGTTLSAAAYTGIADDAVLINVSVFKTRLYFVEKDSTSIWYGGVSNITGGVTEFDVGDVMRHGGYVVFAGSWTRDTGAGTEDLFVIGTSKGEIILYSGNYPASSNWFLVGRFKISIPLGRRSFANIGADLAIITEDGIVPLSQLLATADPIGGYKKTTEKIENAFRQVGALYKSNFGWEVTLYPAGNYALVNIPIIEDTQSEQYVLNTQTGSWCRFTGQNASTWGLLNEKLYFGGMDGKVYQADIGDDDNGNFIDIDLKTAFNYFQDRERLKRIIMAKPIISGDTAVDFSFGVDVDFEDRPLGNTISYTGQSGASWDTATWDLDSWESTAGRKTDWYASPGIGRCVSYKIKGMIKDATFRVSAMHVLYEPGGIL